jgi:hypothetical protein
MGTEIVELVQQAGPSVAAALGAYGAGVLERAEDAAVDATANLGRRILHAIWRRRDVRGREDLEAAVREAVAEPDNEDAGAALRQQIKRTLQEDPDLVREVSGLLPPGGGVTSSGVRSVAAGGSIRAAVTGDHNTVQP